MNTFSSEIILIKCPTCSNQLPWDTKNSYRPFCCERCKLIDLGEWASEQHVIAGHPVLLDNDIDEY